MQLSQYVLMLYVMSQLKSMAMNYIIWFFHELFNDSVKIFMKQNHGMNTISICSAMKFPSNLAITSHDISLSYKIVPCMNC